MEIQLWQQAEALLPQRGIAAYTQPLMNMGATVCTRGKPKCGVCPVQAGCIAFNTGRTTELPTPRPKKAVPERHATFLLLTHGNDILLEKRPGSGIWGGLWCPPQFDDEAAREWFLRSGMMASQGERLATFAHTFTHSVIRHNALRLLTPYALCELLGGAQGRKIQNTAWALCAHPTELPGYPRRFCCLC